MRVANALCPKYPNTRALRVQVLNYPAFRGSILGIVILFSGRYLMVGYLDPQGSTE